MPLPRLVHLSVQFYTQSKMENAKIVASFFFYMWNRWSEEECKIVFASTCWPHLCGKWGESVYRNNGRVMGAAETFFSELDVDNRELLVARATELYDGGSRR